MWTTLANAVRNQCRLINDSSGNREQDTTLEIPHPQQRLHVDNARKHRQEPVQTDQRQLWKQGARHYIRDPTSVTTPSCGQRWQSRQEPVQADQQQLWKQGARHYIRDPTFTATPSCGQRWQTPSGTSADWSTTTLEKKQEAGHYIRDPTSVTTPSCGQRSQTPSGTSADWSTTALETGSKTLH